jgi:RNA polymerase sigma-70 factor (ECF subfamily)
MIDRGQLDRWMAAAADGDRASIDPLFNALWPIVAGYAARLVGNTATAEDVAQDALVQLFSQLDRYDRSRDALTWALTLTTWKCRSARKQVARRAECDALPAPLVDGKALAEERELVRAALETLATLAARDIEVILASVTENEALRAALEPATFRKRLERALARFRMSWRSRHETL